MMKVVLGQSRSSSFFDATEDSTKVPLLIPGHWKTEDSPQDSMEMPFPNPGHWNYDALVPFSPTFFPPSVTDHSLIPADWTATPVASGHSFNLSSWSGSEDPSKASDLSLMPVDWFRALSPAPVATDDLQTHWINDVQALSSDNNWFRTHEAAATEKPNSIPLDWSHMNNTTTTADHSIPIDWSRVQENTIASYSSIPVEWSPTNDTLVPVQHTSQMIEPITLLSLETSPDDLTHNAGITGDQSIDWPRTQDNRIASYNSFPVDWSLTNSTVDHQSIPDDWPGARKAIRIGSATESQRICPSVEEEEEAGEHHQQEQSICLPSPLSSSQESITDEEEKLSASNITLLASDYLQGPMTTRDIIATRIHFRRVLQGQKTLTPEDLEKTVPSSQSQVNALPEISIHTINELKNVKVT